MMEYSDNKPKKIDPDFLLGPQKLKWDYDEINLRAG